MLGPFIETLVISRFGARGNFLAVALINVVVSVVMFVTARETLPVAEQKPINLIDCSPLSFFKMMRTGSENVRLMIVLLLQSFGELRINQVSLSLSLSSLCLYLSLSLSLSLSPSLSLCLSLSLAR